MCTKAVQSGAVFPVIIGLITSWTAIGRGTENTGRFVFDIEDRHEIGPRTPNSLGRQISTLQPTANLFNDRGFVVRDLFYVQRLVEGQVRFLIGRAEPIDYFGSTWMQSANNSFVNRMFASNPTGGCRWSRTSSSTKRFRCSPAGAARTVPWRTSRTISRAARASGV